MAASLAFADFPAAGERRSSTSCRTSSKPDGMTLGKPQFYATAMPFGADAIGLLVEEPRRSAYEDRRQPRSSIQRWRDERVRAGFDPESLRPGSRADGDEVWRNPDLVFVCGQRASHRGCYERLERRRFPYIERDCHFADACAQIQSLLTLFPQAKWHQWEPPSATARREGAKLAFGSYLNTVYRPEKADVILSLDSDFLGSGPGHIRYAREFSRRRNLDHSSKGIVAA